MTGTITPHGGTLVSRIAAEGEREEWLRRAKELPGWQISTVTLSDLECIATGVFSPLTGFLGEEDYLSVRDRMRLADGTVWPLPITLPVPEDRADQIREGKPVALWGRTADLRGDGSGEPLPDRSAQRGAGSVPHRR